MANINMPSGLAPVMYLNGAPWNGQARMYYIASNNGSAFAIGDPVASSGDGDATLGIPGVVLATAGVGNKVRGVIVGAGVTPDGGPYVDPSNLGTIIVPATKTKAYYVAVCDDPNVIFEIQEGGVGAALTSAAIGTNYDLLSGTNNGYLSGWLLDNNSAGTGATVQLRTLGLARRPGNVFGTYAKWNVLINNHEIRPGTVGT